MNTYYGCPICHPRSNTSGKQTNTKTTLKYIKIAKLIHDNKYVYKENSQHYTCIKHGKQEIGNLRDHLLAIIPCDTCNKERLKERYIKQSHNSNNGKTNMYIVKITSKHSSEEFYKLGLTFTTISDRFKDWSKYYTIETLLFKEGSVEKTYNLEQSLHTSLTTRNLSYTPYFTNNLGGSSECFVATEEFITKLTEYTNNKLTGYSL